MMEKDPKSLFRHVPPILKKKGLLTGTFTIISSGVCVCARACACVHAHACVWVTL